MNCVFDEISNVTIGTFSDRYSSTIGTPEHDAIKKQTCDLSRDMYSAISDLTQAGRRRAAEREIIGCQL